MNNFIWKIILTVLISISFTSTYALEIDWPKIFIQDTTTVNITASGSTEVKKVTISDIFDFFASYYKWEIPESYKYIKLNYKDIKKWGTLEDSLKVLTYLNLIKNPSANLNKDSELNAWSFYRLSEKILWVEIVDTEAKEILQKRNTTNNDLINVANSKWNKTISIDTKDDTDVIKQKLTILNDVYDTIINWHYDKDKLDEVKVIDSAISWIALWTNDKHTVYFPTLESKSFQEILSWNYEWIWSYVDMEQPWLVRIISPISGSPSEKAWLKWWDLIMKVDGKEVTKLNSLNEVISWIKWPAGTTVLLTIKRDLEIIEIKVIREKIVIKDIESSVLNWNTYYIQIKSFWENVSDDFKTSLTKLKEQKNINKVIIDLRNNWWGYLTEVADILSYFIKQWDITASVKYQNSEQNYTSRWYDLIDFSKYKIIILQNSWTASASEILIWTLKDYYPNIVLLWENTYGKGSVQVMKNYSDWSLLKYTIAKWFTWKTKTWIDWIWIKPDIKLELDLENFNKNKIDNQLDEALKIN